MLTSMHVTSELNRNKNDGNTHFKFPLVKFHMYTSYITADNKTTF
jgi:hypothetical protein